MHLESTSFGIRHRQVYLGVEFTTGKDVPHDYKEAARFYRLAADHGSPEGEYLLGKMYETGMGVPRNDQLAHHWIANAAADESPQAKADLKRESHGSPSVK
jgi:TPR repeat protein